MGQHPWDKHSRRGQRKRPVLTEEERKQAQQNYLALEFLPAPFERSFWTHKSHKVRPEPVDVPHVAEQEPDAEQVEDATYASEGR